MEQWVEQALRRLHGQKRKTFASAVESFLDAYNRHDSDVVAYLIPLLYHLADKENDSTWRAAIGYYDAETRIMWRGDLVGGMDAITDALVRGLHTTLPRLPLREMLLAAWLAVDPPGYAPLVLRGLREHTSTNPWLSAQALAAIGRTTDAYQLAIREQSAYRRGHALLWNNQPEEAAEHFRVASARHGEFGEIAACVEARLMHAETLITLERYDEAILEAESAVARASDIPNPAQVGRGLALLGQALVHQSVVAEAIGCYKVALETLDGHGWLRDEAEIALAYLALTQQHPDMVNGGESALDVAEPLVYRLRSDDLQARLAALTQ